MARRKLAELLFWLAPPHPRQRSVSECAARVALHALLLAAVMAAAVLNGIST